MIEVDSRGEANEIHTRAAIWHGPQGDVPISVIEALGKGEDGIKYLRIAESLTGIPAHEVTYQDQPHRRSLVRFILSKFK
jgi:hypothetical protein